MEVRIYVDKLGVTILTALIAVRLLTASTIVLRKDKQNFGCYLFTLNYSYRMTIRLKAFNISIPSRYLGTI